MNKQANNLKAIAAVCLFAISAATIAGCKKDTSNPQPVEQELITTVLLTLKNGADSATYTYKVENGFNSSTPGIVRADTLRLMPGVAYAASLTVLNEKATPVEDITTEIVEEQDEHLFLYVSAPASGAGSVVFGSGNVDGAGKPFNLAGTLTAGSAGAGTLNIYLLHEPTDKTGATPAASGGETDAQATFPVRIQ